MSFAIFETGGKQYKASASKIIEIEKLDVEVGKTIQFKNVLLLNDSKTTEIGSPNVTGAIVEAKLLDNVKDRTILIFHKMNFLLFTNTSSIIPPMYFTTMTKRQL